MRNTIGAFEGTTLAGEALAVPRDLTLPRLVCFAYQQHQQSDVDSWLGQVRDDHRLDVLEVPVLGRRWLPGRRFIDGGMAAKMDQGTRERTMCVYTDVSLFRMDVLGTARGEVAAVLVAPDGRIHWHAFGRADPVAAAELHLAIARIVDTTSAP